MQLDDSAHKFFRSLFDLALPLKDEQCGLSLGGRNLPLRRPLTVSFSRPPAKHLSPFLSITFKVRGDNLLIFHQHSRFVWDFKNFPPSPPQTLFNYPIFRGLALLRGHCRSLDFSLNLFVFTYIQGYREACATFQLLGELEASFRHTCAAAKFL